MSEELIHANSLSSERAPSLEEFAALHGVSTTVAASMLADRGTTQAIHEETKARALLAQPAIANRLVRIINGADDKDAMAAAGILLKLSGGIKAPRPIQLSFDELLKRAQAGSAGPLTGITQIVEAVIDSTEDGDDSDTAD